jgi:hypothetical protein
MFSLLPPSLLRSLSDAFISHFIMDADERLRFTIVITQQTIYWKGGQMAEVLSTLDQRTRRLPVGAGTRRPLPATLLPTMA